MDKIGLFLAAVSPAILIIWYIYSRDKYDKEPPELLTLSFFMGILSIPFSIASGLIAERLGVFDSFSLPVVFFQAFVVVAFAEDFGKFVFLLLFLYPRKHFDEPYDGIMYAVMVGMGFATFENVLYVLDGGIKIALLRAFTAVPAHAAFGVLMGYYVGLAKFDPANRTSLLLRGLLASVVAHGTYDFFIMQHLYKGLVVLAFAVLAIAVVLSRQALRMHQELSPFNPHNLPEEPELERMEKERLSGRVAYLPIPPQPEMDGDVPDAPKPDPSGETENPDPDHE